MCQDHFCRQVWPKLSWLECLCRGNIAADPCTHLGSSWRNPGSVRFPGSWPSKCCTSVSPGDRYVCSVCSVSVRPDNRGRFPLLLFLLLLFLIDCMYLGLLFFFIILYLFIYVAFTLQDTLWCLLIGHWAFTCVAGVTPPLMQLGK